ncbi:excalibur calcium-binding domain-containing protein [Amycolatopsis antarctica]|uniref:excalibur calcium-binding domain-containing protein n=1 Tax=Amycolatopsis antarctica TaxID=1854586 RepID=UPI001F0B2F59|nr:excalibur calcium-binding domain-containing protein [Amycolatopsis antarctica]
MGLLNKTCSDFTYQEDAQAAVGLYPDLDRDKDGRACESLPSRPTGGSTTTPVTPEPEPTTTSPSPEPVTPVTTQPAAPAAAPVKAADKDCADYSTQAAAQAALLDDPSDPNNLDADNDQFACESKFGAPAKKTSQQVKVHPSGGVATGGDEGVSGTDGAGYALGGLLLAGAGAVLVAGRRARSGN